MLIPKKNRKTIYEYLFKEGVLVAKKDFNRAEHQEIKDIPNLQVVKALQSLKSRGYVKEQFSWGWYYWYLTNEGIQYLREYLHLPQEIVPATLKRPVRTETAKPRPREQADRSMRDERDDRDAYRSFGDEKKTDAGPGAHFEPQFRQGFGRGQSDGPRGDF
ncbi:PREDICTED: 40S ribosomal protein S10-like [Amphimedon queenslandica]|uniref:Plectin/eS10 N-terminal domain-containing protein n=1 Tax=Amphimedon queenslandica TaxID=400682 RepID=A0A1X7U9D1_AMPQE|nr:PREDICTED: 40S ribosomal protein S10-like [Amphimedon queenslandica]XP_019855484.1 PREDICTED: 40S ribosomal protein S10-like [Amphimedon queenslandica]|eukprot:XP_003388638.1 PREDICTED: 40S ribosomal protein S10-like [Amphimedon queenslandica]